LKLWLAQAKEGDKVAQTYVGEMYEKGLGVQPDYGRAAEWYRKAAEQGYARAQMNFGYLYEKGLGVEKDPMTASAWYRKAVGLSDAIAMDPASITTEERKELQELRGEVERWKRESESLRPQLKQTQQQLAQTQRKLEQREGEAETERRRLEQARQELEGQRKQTEAAHHAAELKRLEGQLKQREADLDRQHREITRLHQERSQLEGEALRYRQQLPQMVQPVEPPDPPKVAPLILANVYDYLYEPGIEPRHYGLFSYVLFPAYSPRAERFLDELFKTTSYAGGSLIEVESLNVIYLPRQVDQLLSLRARIAEGSAPPAHAFVTQFYNYHLAQKLLAQICAMPADVIRDLCATDLSRGPYEFTYARPASTLSPVPPPYLVLDLSDVHIRAFGEFIAAYKAQVKRLDYSGRQRIDTLRLRMLNVVLTAADWISPTKSAIADILHMARGEGGSTK
jgi:Sel1 repeat